ncbi:MAG TPA: tripartite tricarboxylate transporter substrate binding protein [Burkholderiales bacterium]|nr:tripartite tricarboxylate transporter substrate binding protein [Burkholderiales bacterium]
MKRSVCLLAMVLGASGAAAQQYPAKPVKIIVAFSPGGSTDLLARAVGQKLGERWGQPVVVENRVGASGMIGADAVAKSAPDGYTLLMCSPQEVAVNHHVFPKVPYDPRRDLAPITLVTVTPLVIAVNPGVPAKDIAALVALAKAKPGTLGYATPGTASTQHLTGEILQAAAGIKLVHVPYKGAGQSIPDVIGGQVPIGVYGILTISPQAKAGKLRILAVTTPKRSPIAPDVPTMAESGFPGFDTSLWFGLLAPAGTPKDVIAKIHDDTARALKLPDVAERIAAQGGEVIGSTPAQFAAFIAAEDAKYAKIIREAGVRLE